MNRLMVLCVLMVTLFGCGDDFYPSGFYANEVERMLAGQNTLKTWTITDLRINGESQSLTDCLDSVKVIFTSNISQTTIEAYDLRYQSGCTTYDSIYYGVLTASAVPDRAANEGLFTDTLHFDGGEIDYLILLDINPVMVRWMKEDSVSSEFRFSAQQ